nr:immunoglobulin light chain junction region [Macaca mulatta]
CQKYIVAPLTF